MSRHHCPHCGWPYDAEAQLTGVVCGSCGAEHDILGRKEDLLGRQFWCEVCGELNILPVELDERENVQDDREGEQQPEAVADGGRPP